MKKRIFSLFLMGALLCSALWLMAFPTEAMAGSIKLGGITLKIGQYLKQGSTTVTETRPSNNFAYYHGGKLFLYDFRFDAGNNDFVQCNDALTVELHGTSKITAGKKGIVTSGDLTFQGSGTLELTTNNDSPIVSQKSIAFTGGTVTVSTAKSGVYAVSSANTVTVSGGKLSISANGGSAGLTAPKGYTQSNGKVTITVAQDRIGLAVQSGTTTLSGGTLTITNGNQHAIDAKDIHITNTDVTITTDGQGICANSGAVTINGSANIHIASVVYAIKCSSLTVKKAEEILLTNSSDIAGVIVTDTLSIEGTVKASASRYTSGNQPFPLSKAQLPNSRYAYFRNPDLTVGGIPMALGDYLHQSWTAASTYKPSDNYASVSLNGDTTELYLKNFTLTTQKNYSGVYSDSNLKLHLSGTNSITATNGRGIHLNSKNLYVISGGTLNLTTTYNGIDLGYGSYTQYGDAVINIRSDADGINAQYKDVTVKSGKLTITAKQNSVRCVNFTVSGGEVDIQTTSQQSYAALVYTNINYGSLTAQAATTVNGPLVPFSSAYKISNKRIVIAAHRCSGQYVAGVSAQCTTSGKQAYYKCSCGKCYEDASCTKLISNISTWGILPSKGHAVSDWRTTGAYHYKVCTTCGEFLEQEDHHGGKATCRAKALCVVCNTYYGAMGDHTWSATWDYATADGHAHFCINDGCDFCSPFAKHTPDIPAPTETRAQKCKDCGYTIAPPVGHICKDHLTKVAANEASCTQDGNTEYYQCSCGKYYQDAAASAEITDPRSVVIRAGHTDKNQDDTCDVCRTLLFTGSTDPSQPTQPTTADPSPTETTAPPSPTETTAPSDNGVADRNTPGPEPQDPATAVPWWIFLMSGLLAAGLITVVVLLILKKKRRI